MAKISDQVVQEDEENNSTLKTPTFDVNMRLFHSSIFYRQIIMDCIQYMASHLNMTFEDHNSPRGISGAELGLPWNIIAYKHGTNKKFCINPKIIKKSKELVETETKCGALKLDKGVKLQRHMFIDLEYFDTKGQKIVERSIGRNEGGFTIQHEVDHNMAISILDREIK